MLFRSPFVRPIQENTGGDDLSRSDKNYGYQGDKSDKLREINPDALQACPDGDRNDEC